MWILLIITLAGVFPDGSVFPSKVAPVATYRTLQDCEVERIRITQDMQKAYPVEEHGNFYFECKEAPTRL